MTASRSALIFHKIFVIIIIEKEIKQVLFHTNKFQKENDYVFRNVVGYVFALVDAVRLLGEKVGVNVSGGTVTNIKKDDYFEIYEYANKFYQNSLFTSLGKNATQYLEGRNIDKETIKKFGIGLSIQKLSLTEYLKNKKYSIDKLIDVGLTNDNGNDIFVNRIMFPIYDLSGNPVAFSGRIYNT